MSYDQRCFELAEYFLMDEPNVLKEGVSDLAQHIQDAIEDWFEAQKENGEKSE